MSAASQPQPLSTAYYYDPHSRCIKCDPALAQVGDDGTITLHGIIVEVEDARGNVIPSSSFHLQPGEELMGEVIEIIDLDEVESSGKAGMDRVRQVRSSAKTVASATATAGGGLTLFFLEAAIRLMQEAEDDSYSDISQLLLQKQRQLQSLHAQEYQRLLHKQKKDWLWFNQQHLGEKRLLELEAIHQRESMELQSCQQKEQNEMSDFAIFKCIPLMKSHGKEYQEQARVVQTSTSTQTETIVPSASASTPTKAIIASSSVSTQTDPIIGGLDITPPLASSAAFLRDRISTDRQRADEIKAVMRDRSISRDERQKKLAEIKERFTISSTVSTSIGSEKKTSVKKKNDGQGREEQVKDVSLMKEVKTVTTLAPISGFGFQHHSGSKSGQEGDEAPKTAQDRDDEAPKTALTSRWNAMVSGAGAGPSRKPDDVAEDDSDSSVGADTRNLVTDDGCCDDDQEQSKLSSGYQKANMRWKRAAVKVGTTNLVVRKVDTSVMDIESNHDVSNDPLDIATDRTPMKKLIKRLKNNDPSLTVLKLDLRKRITDDDWQSLFESLEGNSSLTHLSISRCEINDSLCVALVLALVENTALVDVRLNCNEGLTDDTGKGLIKILSINSNLRNVGLARTSVSKKVLRELNNILGKRNRVGNGLAVEASAAEDDELINSPSSKMLTARASSKKSLNFKGSKADTSHHVSESTSKSDRRGGGGSSSNDNKKTENENRPSISKGKSNSSNEDKKTEHGCRPSISKGTSNSSNEDKKTKHGRRPSISKGKSNNSNEDKKTENGRRPSMSKEKSNGSYEDKVIENGRCSSVISNEGKNIESGRISRRGSDESGRRGSITGAAAHRQSVLRASITARTMAQLGEDITNVGVDISKLREQRKFRGECDTCGRKCYTKTLFKTTPLTIPNMVENGRCLKCNP